MVKINCVKVKKGKVTKISNSMCSPENIKRLNKNGYSVARSTIEGNHTKIESFSALTFNQARAAHRKRFGNIAFN